MGKGNVGPGGVKGRDVDADVLVGECSVEKVWGAGRKWMLDA